MELDRFEALCDAYGGDIDRWPDDEREAANALVEANPQETRLMLEAARALDEALAAAVYDPPSELLYQRIVAEGARATLPQRPTWAAAAAAVMLTVGLGAGWLAAPTPADAPSEDVYASAFGSFETLDSLEEDV